MAKTRLTTRKYKARPLDMRSFAAAMEHPGGDTRQWISYGKVTADEGEDLVIFDTDENQVFVQVTLEPSRTPVLARLGGMAAGNGEGEYFPFVEGDEVLCAIPEGSETAGVVIIARLNNQIDKFPMDSVAGQDPTTNTFAFSRRRTPTVSESAGPITLRSALNDGLISIDTAGAVTIRDTNGSALQISADGVSLMGQEEPDAAPTFVFQMSLTDGVITLQADDAIFNLSASSAETQANSIITPGSFTLQNSGNAAIEHVTTTEQVANVITQVLVALAAFSPGPLTGAAIGTFLTLPAYSAAWTVAATAPLTVPSPTLPAAIAAAIAAQAPKQATVPTQQFPGVASAGLFSG